MPTSGSPLPSDSVSTPVPVPAQQPQVTVQIQVPQQSAAPTAQPAPTINQTAFNRLGTAHPEVAVPPVPTPPQTTGVTISVQGSSPPIASPAPTIVTSVSPAPSATPALPVVTPIAPPAPIPVSPKAAVIAVPTPPTETQPKVKHSLVSIIVKWILVVALTAQGLKGFFDSLYFIMVEFQNFEKGVSESLAEPALMNQLMTKAALLIFATALSFFFSLQLTLFQEKGPGKLKMLMSFAIGISCFFVLHYANTINVVDVFK
jgi:hypothetical protein